MYTLKYLIGERDEIGNVNQKERNDNQNQNNRLGFSKYCIFGLSDNRFVLKKSIPLTIA